MNPATKTYSIGTAAKMTGLPKYKLRHWCDRYLPHIQRIDIGDGQHRRFSETDIGLIRQIKEFMEGGQTLKSAVDKALHSFKEE